MRILLFASALVIVVVLVAAFKLSRAGYESPDYRVELENGAFEIREYPSMVLASTPMADAEAGEDGSFMRLFRYISGANAADEKIAMTTPVLMTREAGGGRMSFIAPRDLAATGAPPATDGEVRLETMRGGRFAAYRFSGRRDPASLEEAERKLVAWARSQNLATVGQPIIAGYDPPFTPPFLRRNEILIRLAE